MAANAPMAGVAAAADAAKDAGAKDAEVQGLPLESLSLEGAPTKGKGPAKGKKTKKKKNADKKELKKRQLQERLELNRQITARLNAARFVDEERTAVRDMLSPLPPFAKYKCNGLDLELKSFARLGGVPPEVLQYCLDLTERNMKDLYVAAGWGWNENKKRRELEHDEARLVVAFDVESKQPVGFLHTRFLREDDALVAYVYELQIEQEKAGRKGLGRHLMRIVELAARKWELDWVMLTVLEGNTAAGRFYAQLGYQEDETSPNLDPNCDEAEGCPYKILSKSMM